LPTLGINLGLARVCGHEQSTETSRRLCEAQAARAARLHDVELTAAQIETIRDCYKLRARSTLASYGGVLCRLISSADVIAASSHT
jgi:hypothetical protein